MTIKTDIYFYFDRSSCNENLDEDWADLVIEDIAFSAAEKTLNEVSSGKMGDWLWVKNHLICLKKLKYAKLYQYEVELDEE